MFRCLALSLFSFLYVKFLFLNVPLSVTGLIMAKNTTVTTLLAAETKALTLPQLQKSPSTHRLHTLGTNPVPKDEKSKDILFKLRIAPPSSSTGDDSSIFTTGNILHTKRAIANPPGESRSNKRYSTEEDASLLHLRAKKFIWKVIGELLGRTESSVYERHKRLTVGSRPSEKTLLDTFTVSNEVEIVSLKKAGQSNASIQSNFPEKSPASWRIMIRYLAQKYPELGFIKRNYFSPDEDAKMIELRAKGISWKNIHRNYLPNHSVGSMITRFSRLGLATQVKENQLHRGHTGTSDKDNGLNIDSKKTHDSQGVSTLCQ